MNDRNLLELAAKITEAHRKALGGIRETLSGAVEAGRLLIVAQEQVECGAWIEWVKTHLALSIRTVQKYKRLAIHATELRENAPFGTLFGINEALEFLADAADADLGEATADEAAAAIAEEESDEEESERRRERREAQQDEAQKFTRKIKTLCNLPVYFAKTQCELSDERLEAVREAILELARWAGLEVEEAAAAAAA